MGIDPGALGELWNRERSSPRAARSSTSSTAAASCSAGGRPVGVKVVAGLLVEKQGEPLGMAQRRGFAGCFDLTEDLRHAVEAELTRSSVGWVSKAWSPIGSSAKPRMLEMEDRRAVRGPRARGAAIELVVEASRRNQQTGSWAPSRLRQSTRGLRLIVLRYQLQFPLFTRTLSLMCARKFPVRSHREFRSKPLIQRLFGQ
jgi:hypothetical protein